MYETFRCKIRISSLESVLAWGKYIPNYYILPQRMRVFDMIVDLELVGEMFSPILHLSASPSPESCLAFTTDSTGNN